MLQDALLNNAAAQTWEGERLQLWLAVTVPVGTPALKGKYLKMPTDTAAAFGRMLAE
jgi:hypothetical protein